MSEVLLVLVGVLSAATVGAAVEYYRQLRRVQKEYEKAKEAVEDIVVSFNSQLRREAQRLELAAYKIEAVSAKSEKALGKAEEASKKVQMLDEKIGSLFADREALFTRLGELDKKICDIAESHETLTKKVSALEGQERQIPLLQEAKVEAVIPIKREKALAPLTQTELSVLETLASEGPKTAPEIKAKIKLSREHTARLMKKLYEEGYVERETGKIPFRYRVKEELGKLLKKPLSETA
ncbi:MAG: helix-turn-helix domain-containing protein [Candidatus Bathyarchaeia archaeon]